MKRHAILYILVCTLLMVSCNSYEKDKQIKADLTIKAKEDINFAGVNFTVKNRDVKIWGNCPTYKSKMAILQKLGTIHVINHIDDQLAIGQLYLGQDHDLKLLADSLLAKHPESWAVITDQNVILKGNVKEKQLPKLLEAIHQQIPERALINQTTVN